MPAVLLAVAFAVLIAVPAGAQGSDALPMADLRVAFFSPQRAFLESAEGKTVHARLASLQVERAREVEARGRQLQERQDALQRSGGILAEPVRRQREIEIQRFEVDLQRFIQDAQAELTGVQETLEGAFLAKLRPALDQVVRDRGLLLVINEDAGFIAWGDAALDITADVIARLDRP